MENFNDLIYEHGMMTVPAFLAWVTKNVDEFPIAEVHYKKRTHNSIGFYNIPAAFDIETSSFNVNINNQNLKQGVMYIWQFGMYGKVCYGRTWDEFKFLVYTLEQILGLGPDLTLPVYVHNLQFEFQWLRKHFEWDKIFLLEKRVPAYARTHGIEFRCSLKLAGGVSLATVGKNLVKYKIEKLVGDLDYQQIRSPETPLTEKELAYCENDIRVLLAYIQEKIETDGDVTKIPITNTGYVRRYTREACFHTKEKT